MPAIESAPDSQKLTVAALQKRLASECPDLLLLIKAPPIRLVGLQRTGKSTFARKLALLRAILLPSHCVAWSTPHREADNLVPETLHPFGTTADGAKDFRAIEAVWMATQAAIDKGTQLNCTICWDEFGSYDAFRHPESLGVSLRSQLREATKHGYFPILVAHGDQANFYPGVAGILGTLRDSTVKVETLGQQVDAYGTMAPTGKVIVTWLDGRTTEIQTPAWLTVELLLSLQPKQTRPALMDAIVASILPMPTVPQTDAERLEALFHKGNEESVRAELASVFEFIASFVPNVGDRLTARQLYKSEKAKEYSITSDNADNLLKQIADSKSHCFEYGKETNKFGSVSRFLLRVALGS